MLLLGGLGGGVGLAQSVLEPLGLLPLLIKGLLGFSCLPVGLGRFHIGSGQLGLVDLGLIGEFLPEPLRFLSQSAGLILGGSGLFLGLVPGLESLVQLPNAHVLHVVLGHETLPLLLVRDGQQAQCFGKGQTSKRLGL